MSRISTQKNENKGVSAEYREVLKKLHRYSNGLITVQEAEKILNFNHKKIAKLLPYLAKNGWLQRIRRGLYLPIPLSAMSPENWTTSNLLVATKIYSPCYIGGWTAAHHWGFTDQLFNSVHVFSEKRARTRENRFGNFVFIVRTVDKSRFFGLETAWEENNKILISDPARTIVDLMDTPALGGGIRHCFEILNEYFSSEYHDEEKLFAYMEKFNNKAAFKRLGFLIETAKIEVSESFIKKCLSAIGRGCAYLDPSLPHRGKQDKKWNIVVNANIV